MSPGRSRLRSDSGPHFSAGAGGWLLAGIDTAAAAVLGAVVAATTTSLFTSTAFPAVPIVSSLSVFFLSMVVLHFVPISRAKAVASLIWMVSGILAATGVLVDTGLGARSDLATDLVVLGTGGLLGMLGVLPIWKDLKPVDTFAMFVGALWAVAVVGFVGGWVATASGLGSNSFPLELMLYAPAFGALIGGALSYAFEPHLKDVAEFLIAPLAAALVSALVLTASSAGHAGIGPAYYATGLGVLVVSGVLVAVAKSTDATRMFVPNSSSADAMPALGLLPDTVHGHGVVLTLGAQGHF
jgi:hypothetical protein